MTRAQIAQALNDGNQYQGTWSENEPILVYRSASGCYVAWPKEADPFEMSERHALDFILAYDLHCVSQSSADMIDLSMPI